jgi:hypothetical protein
MVGGFAQPNASSLSGSHERAGPLIPRAVGIGTLIIPPVGSQPTRKRARDRSPWTVSRIIWATAWAAFEH